MSPLVSVIVPVYNGAKDAPAAISSILSQTWVDFELIVINDGSDRDDTANVLEELRATTADPRFQLFHLRRNVGLAAALNFGISQARGEYIARQDHDDISLPERLERQLGYMIATPRCGLLGTRAEIWREGGPTCRALDHASENAELQFDLMVNNPFVHSSVMLRRTALEEVGVYSENPDRQPPEDYELWSRIARRWEIANLPERLVIYRETPNSMSRGHAMIALRRRLIAISSENIAYWWGGGAVSQTTADAAALLNACYEEVSGNVDLGSMTSLLDIACARIERHTGADLSARKRSLLGNLCHHYRKARGIAWPVRCGPRGWASGVVQWAGGFLRNGLRRE